MNTSEKLCLKWNDFQINISSAFGELREDRDFSDVTLVCEDGKQLEAHKIILATSSPFFMDLLRKSKHPRPLIYMRGIKSEDLVAIIDFLYFGEANVFQENLDGFLAIAEELKLKGLTGTTDDKEILSTKEEFVKTQENSFHITETKKNDGINMFASKQSTDTAIALNDKGGLIVQSALDEQIEAMMETSQNFLSRKGKEGQRARFCKVCGKEGEVQNIKSHIEAIHIAGGSHPCHLCGNVSRSRNGLRQHKAIKHPI